MTERESETERQNKGRLALERNLQKAFKAIQAIRVPLEKITSEIAPTVMSLANLLEQLECCKSLNYSVVPFAESFPDLQVRLVTKIELEIAQKREELEETIKPLKEWHEAASKHCETSASLVRKYSACLDFSVLLLASAAVPSLVEMVEWLEEICALLNNQYLCKEHLLKTALTQEGVGSSDFVSQWEAGDEELLALIKDVLARVEHFLLEKR